MTSFNVTCSSSSAAALASCARCSSARMANSGRSTWIVRRAARSVFRREVIGTTRRMWVTTVYCLSLSDSLVSNRSGRKMSDEKLLKSLGEHIRELRKKRGLSQEKLAELAEIHVNHLRRIELGQANPTYLVLLRLAGALETPLPRLLA
jgi:ribosome-binding protein aMBF1 (putative translation factor)